jgi:dTDP-4-dehydrorhamnose 3,5-epimerase
MAAGDLAIVWSTPLEVRSLGIPELKLIKPSRFWDARGFFSDIYSRQALSAIGISTDFVQDNCSVSKAAGTVRGLHFQIPPMAQAKLVMVLKGRIRDVVVDCRTGSPSYGQHVSVDLDGQEWEYLYIPAGFAHGFCTVEPDTMVFYKVSAPYAPELERGVLWNDPDLAIQWPVTAENALLSDKDKRLPQLRDLADHFIFASDR